MEACVFLVGAPPIPCKDPIYASWDSRGKICSRIAGYLSNARWIGTLARNSVGARQASGRRSNSRRSSPAPLVEDWSEPGYKFLPKSELSTERTNLLIRLDDFAVPKHHHIATVDGRSQALPFNGNRALREPCQRFPIVCVKLEIEATSNTFGKRTILPLTYPPVHCKDITSLR